MIQADDPEIKAMVKPGVVEQPCEYKALILLRQIAAKYPPVAFECESGFGDLECVFCGTILYGHKPDCMAVLIQEFKVDAIEVAE